MEAARMVRQQFNVFQQSVLKFDLKDKFQGTEDTWTSMMASYKNLPNSLYIYIMNIERIKSLVCKLIHVYDLKDKFRINLSESRLCWLLFVRSNNPLGQISRNKEECSDFDSVKNMYNV